MGQPGENIARIRRQMLKRMEALRAQAVKKLAGRQSSSFPAGSPEKLEVLLLEKHLADIDALVAKETAKLP